MNQMKKAIFILMACVLFLITYLCWNTEPEITMLSFIGYKIGINVTDYWYLKAAYFMLFFYLIVEVENKRNGN
jgi:hypothetical protein